MKKTTKTAPVTKKTIAPKKRIHTAEGWLRLKKRALLTKKA